MIFRRLILLFPVLNIQLDASFLLYSLPKSFPTSHVVAVVWKARNCGIQCSVIPTLDYSTDEQRPRFGSQQVQTQNMTPPSRLGEDIISQAN